MTFVPAPRGRQIGSFTAADPRSCWMSYPCDSWRWQAPTVRTPAPFYTFVPLIPRPPRMTVDETIEFISRPFYPLAALLSQSRDVDHGAPRRGRPASKSVRQRLIDLSMPRRRSLYHKLVRLPANRRKVVVTRMKRGTLTGILRDAVYQLADACALQNTPAHKIARNVYKRLSADPRLPKGAEATVRKYLTAWRRNFRK